MGFLEKVLVRQAEEEAARAYAQAVAWSDVEGEKKAADDAQKAGRALSSITYGKRGRIYFFGEPRDESSRKLILGLSRKRRGRSPSVADLPASPGLPEGSHENYHAGRV